MVTGLAGCNQLASFSLLLFVFACFVGFGFASSWFGARQLPPALDKKPTKQLERFWHTSQPKRLLKAYSDKAAGAEHQPRRRKTASNKLGSVGGLACSNQPFC
ncbi:hypothetical protein AAHH84_00195 [Candidatus Hodgkinia cicadicola]